jgi:O-antigen chain-terminating methyltransferase
MTLVARPEQASEPTMSTPLARLECEELTIEHIMLRIREEIRVRLEGGNAAPSRAPGAAVSPAVVSADLRALGRSADVYDVDLSSRRTLFSPLITAARKISRRLLIPSLARQVEYNHANARIVEFLTVQGEVRALQLRKALDELLATQKTARDRAEVMRQRLTEVDDVLAGLRLEIESLCREIVGLRTENASLRTENASLRQAHVEDASLWSETSRLLRERIARAEREIRRVGLVPAAGAPPPPSQPPAAGATLRAPATEVESGFDYAGFEERFRGSEEDIARRQASYVECFRGADEVLDIACGRGEFLEALRTAGIPARGVDIDLDMVLACEAKGLAVTRADAFDHLRGVPDGSLGGIFCAQFIEHIEGRRIIELVRLAYEKLRPGGVLVLETLNPRCLFVFAASFYMDFTHVRPVHPDALKFLYEASGFQDVAVRYSSPVDAGMRIPELAAAPPEFNRAVEHLNDLLYGYQDYAVIGCKDLAQSTTHS